MPTGAELSSAIILATVGAVIAYLFWNIKQSNQRQTTKLDRLSTNIESVRTDIALRTEKFMSAHSHCREDVLAKLADKADRGELIRAHERIDRVDDNVKAVDIKLQSRLAVEGRKQ